jgi:hypothetical protein
MMTTEVGQQSATDFKLPIHNWEALEQLRKEKDALATQPLAVGGAACAAGAIFSPGFMLFALAYPALIRVDKIARIEKVTSLLLENFEDQGVQVFPVQGVEEAQGVKIKNPIDLFIRFPRKTHIFLSIRSKGDSAIVYNEAKEYLQVKRRNRSGLVTWKPCPLVELADYEKWLNKNRDLFRLSSREATKTPTAKTLVLWHPTRADDHRPHLYSELGDAKFLALRRKGTAFVIQEEEILAFFKAWLARYE